MEKHRLTPYEAKRIGHTLMAGDMVLVELRQENRHGRRYPDNFCLFHDVYKLNGDFLATLSLDCNFDTTYGDIRYGT